MSKAASVDHEDDVAIDGAGGIGDEVPEGDVEQFRIADMAAYARPDRAWRNRGCV